MKIDDSGVATLVRDELAAVEAYRLALERLGNIPESRGLRLIRDDHEDAVGLLRSELANAGLAPPLSSGPWGFWLTFVEGAASMVGARAALKTLRSAERRDILDYEQALASLDLGGGLRELIGANILPKTRSHLALLDLYLDNKTQGGGMSYHADEGQGPRGEGRGV